MMADIGFSEQRVEQDSAPDSGNERPATATNDDFARCSCWRIAQGKKGVDMREDGDETVGTKKEWISAENDRNERRMRAVTTAALVTDIDPTKRA